MKLTLNGLKEKEQWEKAGVALPAYDIAAVAEETKKSPVWVHFGAGNIFRIFIGGMAKLQRELPVLKLSILMLLTRFMHPMTIWFWLLP